MKVTIIDDELPAIGLLTDFVERVPFLELSLATTNPVEITEQFKTSPPDLILSDIQMPDISGIDLIKQLPKKPLVIFTTAYETYALEGYDLDIVDYLLKPIRFERFLRAVNRAQERFITVTSNTTGYLEVKSEYKTVKIPLTTILFIEGLKDYVKIHTAEGVVLTRLNLKGISAKLPETHFIRIHRSYIVALSKITAFQKKQLEIGATVLPIGPHYWPQLAEKL